MHIQYKKNTLMIHGAQRLTIRRNNKMSLFFFANFDVIG